MPLFMTHNYAIVGLVYLCVTCHDVIFLCVCAPQVDGTELQEAYWFSRDDVMTCHTQV